MPTDKKITELPVASAISAGDVSVLVDAGTDYQYSFTQLLQFLQGNLVIGAKITFGTVLPQNTEGSNNDVFVNTAAGSFAQKIAGTWAVVYTLPPANAADGTMLYGAGTPSAATGKNLDSYIDTLTGIFYYKSAGAWAQIFSMATGPQGPQGTAGTNGTNGTNGNTILYGTTIPSNSTTGQNGDFYLNTATYTLYGPKAAGVWPVGSSIIGAAGANGAPGQGVPLGGSTGQLLAKIDAASYNTQWVSAPTGAVWGNISGALSSQTDLNTALSIKAPVASPAFTGTPTAPTQPSGDSSTKIATTAYVDKNFTNYPLQNGSIVLGNSIGAGYGNSNNFSFVDAIARYCGVMLNNLSISATGGGYAYYQYSTNKNGFYSQPLLLAAPEFNNMRNGSAAQSVRINACMASMRAILALHYANSIQFPFNGITGVQNSNFTYSTSIWGYAPNENTLLSYASRTYWYRHNDFLNSGSNLAVKPAISANETITITNVQGTAIAIGTWGTDGTTNNWSRIRYTVDGTIYGTYTPNGQTYTGYSDGSVIVDGIIPDAIVITGLSDIPHTVVLTFLDGGKTSQIDYVAGLISATSSKAIPVYKMDMFHMSNASNIGYNYPSYITSQAYLDAATSAVISNMKSTFPNYNIIQVQTNQYYSPETNPTLTQGDGIHPTISGDENILTSLIDVIGSTPFIGTNLDPKAAAGQIAVGNSSGNGFLGTPDFTFDRNTGLFVASKNNSGFPVLVASGNQVSGGSVAVQAEIRNTNTSNNKVQLIIGGGAPGSAYNRTFQFGTDAYGSGQNDFFLYQGNNAKVPLYISSSGKITIGDTGLQASAVSALWIKGSDVNSQLQIGEDLYINSPSSGNGIITTGGYFQGGFWIATQITAFAFGSTNNEFCVYLNTGLTIGSAYTPTLIYKGSSTGFIPEVSGLSLGSLTNPWATVYSSNTPFSIGQATLSSGIISINILGLTTSSKAFVTLVNPSGSSSTVTYQAVCTTDTLTIRANLAAGTINSSDNSTLNYQVFK